MESIEILSDTLLKDPINTNINELNETMLGLQIEISQLKAMQSLLNDEKAQMQKVIDEFRTEIESLQQQINQEKYGAVSEQFEVQKLNDTVLKLKNERVAAISQKAHTEQIVMNIQGEKDTIEQNFSRQLISLKGEIGRAHV